jgi:hypothetical protein
MVFRRGITDRVAVTQEAVVSLNRERSSTWLMLLSLGTQCE